MTNGCDQCQALMINGVYCHEIGCPESWKDYSNECKWCGSTFKPELKGQLFCDTSCAEAYYN